MVDRVLKDSDRILKIRSLSRPSLPSSGPEITREVSTYASALKVASSRSLADYPTLSRAERIWPGTLSPISSSGVKRKFHKHLSWCSWRNRLWLPRLEWWGRAFLRHIWLRYTGGSMFSTVWLGEKKTRHSFRHQIFARVHTANTIQRQEYNRKELCCPY